MNYSTLVQKIKEEEDLIKSTRAKLKGLKNLLKTTFPTPEQAQPGDKLADGCIVIERFPKTILHNERLLIAAPKETQICYQWTPEFKPVFDRLKKRSFNPSEWFIPSVEQLQLAYQNAKQQFPGGFLYWSSDEVSPTIACSLSFIFGDQSADRKTNMRCVRAFRFIEL
jgi:hypothetical protein